MPGRRTHRRCYAILGALHEHGPQYGLDLCRILRCGSGSLYPELWWLEDAGLVVGEFIADPRHPYRPQRRQYRLAADTGRAGVDGHRFTLAADDDTGTEAARPPRTRIPSWLRRRRSA